MGLRRTTAQDRVGQPQTSKAAWYLKPGRYLRRHAGRELALLAGALPVLAFPAPNLEFLAWFGLVPGLLLIYRSPSAWQAAVRGWWFGAGFLIFGMYWLAPEVGPGLLLAAALLGAAWVRPGQRSGCCSGRR